MSAPSKKRNVNLPTKNLSKGEKESDEEENVADDTVIQVDFEGRNPIDSDFHGIKQLLSQLFLKAHINVSELTQLIICQNYIGSVIKQSEADDDANEDDDSDPNQVFGITTVVNLKEQKKHECVSQLRELLLKLCTEFASDEVTTLINSLLSDDSKPIGLLINERFVNIPSQIAVPLLKSLKAEIRRAVNKKMPYDFSHLILISKLYKMDTVANKRKSKKSKKPGPEDEVIWSNPEEEIIDQEAEAKFEFSIKNEADSGLMGDWDENDDEMTPMRRILVIPFKKFDRIIDKIEAVVSA